MYCSYHNYRNNFDEVNRVMESYDQNDAMLIQNEQAP